MQPKHFFLGVALLTTLGGLMWLADQGDSQAVPVATLDAFNRFVRKHRRQFQSLSERNYRLRVFHENLLTIEQHNQKNLSYSLGVNKFADLTWEEFSKAYLRQDVKIDPTEDHTPLTYPRIGEKDWFKEGKVSPVKDQGDCSDCFAFGALSSFESALLIKHNKPILLSEKEVIDCSGSYGNSGCKGGEMDQTFDYIIDHGINLQADYPYKPKDEKCQAKMDKPRYSMAQYRRIFPINMNGLLAAVDQRPVSVCFECQKSFHLYDKGVYKAPENCGKKRTHCVLMFGYGTDKETKMEFTRMKNSWGNDWGEKGFFRMELVGGMGNCGIASYDSLYPILD